MTAPTSSLEEALDRAMKQPTTQGLADSSGSMHGRHRSGSMGVTKHKRTQRYEAHIWIDKKQVYLGAYDSDVQASRAHDVMALRCKGPSADLNHPRQEYAEVLPFLTTKPQAEVVASLRNYSKSLSITRQRGSSSSSRISSGAGGSGGRGAPRGKRKLSPPSDSEGAGAAGGSQWGVPGAAWGDGGAGVAAADASGGGGALEQAKCLAAEGAAPVRQSARRRAAAVAAAAAQEQAQQQQPLAREQGSGRGAAAGGGALAFGGAGAGAGAGLGSGIGSPFSVLSIEPLQLAPPERALPRIRTTQGSPQKGMAGLQGPAGQPPPGRAASKLSPLSPDQRALSAAGSLGVAGTPLSPASSLAVRNLLALANQPSLSGPLSSMLPPPPQAPRARLPPGMVPTPGSPAAARPAAAAWGSPLGAPPGAEAEGAMKRAAVAAMVQQLQQEGILPQAPASTAAGPGPVPQPGPLPLSRPTFLSPMMHPPVGLRLGNPQQGSPSLSMPPTPLLQPRSPLLVPAALSTPGGAQLQTAQPLGPAVAAGTSAGHGSASSTAPAPPAGAAAVGPLAAGTAAVPAGAADFGGLGGALLPAHTSAARPPATAFLPIMPSFLGPGFFLPTGAAPLQIPPPRAPAAPAGAPAWPPLQAFMARPLPPASMSSGAVTAQLAELLGDILPHDVATRAAQELVNLEKMLQESQPPLPKLPLLGGAGVGGAGGGGVGVGAAGVGGAGGGGAGLGPAGRGGAGAGSLWAAPPAAPGGAAQAAVMEERGTSSMAQPAAAAASSGAGQGVAGDAEPRPEGGSAQSAADVGAGPGGAAHPGGHLGEGPAGTGQGPSFALAVEDSAVAAAGAAPCPGRATSAAMMEVG